MSTTPTPGDDTIDGDVDSPDIIQGLGGDDLIRGNGAGTDETDQLEGQAGNDTLVTSGSGSGALIGGADNDSLVAGASGVETGEGGAGNDTLIGDAGTDYLFGDDNDFSGAPATPFPGNDVLDGGDGADLLSGGPGDDILTPGASGNVFTQVDSLRGGDGDDTLALPGDPAGYSISLDGFGNVFVQSNALLGGANVRAILDSIETLAFGVTAQQLAAGTAPLTTASLGNLFSPPPTTGRAHFAISDTITVARGTETVALSIAELLANDFDPDGDTLTLLNLTPTGGPGITNFRVATDPTDITNEGYDPALFPEGVLVVNLDAPLTAPLRFTYETMVEAEDAGGNLDTVIGSTATVTLNPVGAADDVLRGNYGGEFFIPYSTLLANDGPGAAWGGLVSSFILGGTITDDPGRGGIVIDSPGPFGNQAFFSYALAGFAGTADVVVDLDNGAPVAVPLARVVTPGTTFTLPFSEIVGHFGHFDPELNGPTEMGRILGGSGSGATFTVTATGVEVTFAPGYAGGFTLDYTLLDDRGAESRASTISFLTTAPPPPVANADTLTWGIGDGRSLFEGSLPGYGKVWSRELLANDTFMPGTVRLWNAPFDSTPGDDSQLTRALERGIPGLFGVTDPTDNGFGLEFRPGITSDTLVYTIIDPLGREAQGEITFNVTVPQPQLADNVIVIPAGATSVTLNAADILGNDTFTGAGAIAEVQGIGVGGIVDSGVDIGGGRTGIDRFTVDFNPPGLSPGLPLSAFTLNILTFDTAADGGSANGSQRVTFALDAPLVANADTVRWTYGTTAALPVERLLANDSGLGTLEITSPGASGTVTTALGRTVTGANTDADPQVDELRYTAPGAGAPDTPVNDSFTYAVLDGAGRVATSNVTILVNNTAPVAPDFTFLRAPGSILNANFLLSGTSDPDGDGRRITEFAGLGGATVETIRDATTNAITGYRLDYDPANGAATFRYVVEDDSGAIGATDSGLITVAPFEIGVAARFASVAEGTAPGAGGQLQFTFTRTGDPSLPATVTYVTGPGATNGATADDVGGAFPGGTITFAANQQEAFLSFSATPDARGEPDETLTLTITGAGGGIIGAQSSATITIANDDGPPPVVTVVAFAETVQEGRSDGAGSSVQFNFTRTGNIAGPATVTYAVGPGATNGVTVDDVGSTFPTGTIAFAAGQATTALSFAITNDTLDEPNETITLTLTGATDAVIGTPSSATVTILDDDAPPNVFTIAPQNATVTEGTAPGAGGSLVFVVTRSGDLSNIATVNFETTLASTTAAVDDVVGGFPFGALLFQADEAQRSITIPLAPDNRNEPDETYTITLTGSASGVIGAQASATITILDDDAPPPLPTAALDAAAAGTVNEGNDATATLNTPLEFTIRRSGDLSQAGTVTFVLDAASGSTLIAADIGFVAAGGNGLGGGFGPFAADFAAGEESKIIFVFAAGDRVPEADEAVRLTLTGGTGATLSTTGVLSATGTFANDDVLPTIALQSASAGSVAEGDTTGGQLQFVITRTGDLSYATQVGFNLGGANGATEDDIVAVAADGTFIADGFGDYAVNFAVGQASRTITVTAAGDTTPEADESVVLTLTGAALGTLSTTGPLSATGTFANDDVFPEIALSSTSAGTALEGDAISGQLQFIITRAGDLSYGTEVTFSLAAGAGGTTADDIALIADAGTSLGSGFGTFAVTFNPGEAQRIITVAAAGDTVPESDEDVVLTLLAANEGTLSTTGPLSATGTFVNDDIFPEIALSSASAGNAPEGDAVSGQLQFVITRSGDLTYATEVTFSLAAGTGGTTADDVAIIADGGTSLGSGFGTFTIAFSTGETQRVINVVATPDTVPEADEDVVLTLLSATEGTLSTTGPLSATGTFANDDVTPPNAPPVGVADRVGTTRNTAVTFDILANDIDVDGDTILAGAFTLPANGTLALNGDLLTYTPRAGFSGTDSFTYRPFDGTAQGNVTTVTIDVSGPGGDFLVGTPGPDTLAGLGGNDTILGLEDADLLRGDAGDDSIEAGAGNDTLLGSNGRDTLAGGADDDSLRGGAGEDSLLGGAGADTLRGDAGDDVLDGDTGADLLEGGAGEDLLRGGADADTLRGGAGQDTLEGGAGDDFIRGAAGNDLLFGDGGNDRLVAGEGADTIEGGADDGAFIFTDGDLTGYRAGDVIDLRGPGGGGDGVSDLIIHREGPAGPGSGGLDVILGFEPGLDRILFIDTIGEANGTTRVFNSGDLAGGFFASSGTSLAAGVFIVGVSQVTVTEFNGDWVLT